MANLTYVMILCTTTDIE